MRRSNALMILSKLTRNEVEPFFKFLAHFNFPFLSKVRWLGAFNPHDEVSQHQYDFLTV
jgi:hypothetical protein